MFNDQEIKLVNYADDTTAILRDENSATMLFQVLESFEKISGLKVNIEKTKGFWLGSQKLSNKKNTGN